MASDEQLITTDGWVVFLDIFAFGSMLKNTPLFDISKTLSDLYIELSSFLRTRHLPTNVSHFGTRAFSDTLVLYCNCQKGDAECFRFLERTVAEIIHIALERGFIYRGAFAYGAISLGPNFILGDAYLQAYIYESQIIRDPFVVIPEIEFIKSGLRTKFSHILTTFSSKSLESISRGYVVPYIYWEYLRGIAKVNALRSDSNTLEIWERLEQYAKEIKCHNDERIIS